MQLNSPICCLRRDRTINLELNLISIEGSLNNGSNLFVSNQNKAFFFIYEQVMR